MQVNEFIELYNCQLLSSNTDKTNQLLVVMPKRICLNIFYLVVHLV